jgi:hypothetical protein
MIFLLATRFFDSLIIVELIWFFKRDWRRVFFFLKRNPFPSCRRLWKVKGIQVLIVTVECGKDYFMQVMKGIIANQDE